MELSISNHWFDTLIARLRTRTTLFEHLTIKFKQSSLWRIVTRHPIAFLEQTRIEATKVNMCISASIFEGSDEYKIDDTRVDIIQM
ncbi:hypothetical protein GIB67_013397 [Kingdonia uniflora]|uniref:Uncharacterized protein n=1 Tax=Kingdonia uniflora TaxID=39325 RepID=A0A7J7LQW8_9MAGN|nr:hypothetical protein GIB67_013397 [Kingdonia uniflora]